MEKLNCCLVVLVVSVHANIGVFAYICGCWLGVPAWHQTAGVYSCCINGAQATGCGCWPPKQPAAAAPLNNAAEQRIHVT
jgi:hypothetical protein